MARFLPERDAGEEFLNADLLFAEGSGLFGPEGAGTPEQVRANLDRADATRTVLTHFNEHIAETHTERLREIATSEGYELGSDLTTYHQ